MPLFVSSIYYNFEIPDNEIDTTKMVNILRFLLNQGINIQFVSADGYQNIYFLQQAALILNDPKKVHHFFL